MTSCPGQHKASDGKRKACLWRLFWGEGVGEGGAWEANGLRGGGDGRRSFIEDESGGARVTPDAAVSYERTRLDIVRSYWRLIASEILHGRLDALGMQML